jgi:glycosyltransferase involved in cell wall biosynthesis
LRAAPEKRDDVRLTILNQFYPPDISPTAHLARSLAEHRAAHGDQVTIVTSRGGYVQPHRSRATDHSRMNPRIIRLWTPQLGKKRKLFRILDYAAFYVAAGISLVRLAPQDVIVSMTTPPFIAVTALLHKLLHRHTKLVLWNMDCYPEVVERFGIVREAGWLARIMRTINRWLFARIDHLVTLDAPMQELLLSQYSPGTGRLSATTIPNWEAASLFPRDAAPPRWQQGDALGLVGRFVVLYLGNAGYGHRFDTVLEAASILRDDAVTFLFVGGGRRWNDIEEATRRRQLTNIVMLGYVAKEDTPAVMRVASCSLITLDDLALGVMSPSKLHSMLAMGLPIIYVGPRRSNVDVAVQRFQCGFSIRHGETEAMVRSIRQLAESLKSVEEMRRRARQAFDEAYCDLQTLPQFDSVLESLRVTTLQQDARR